MKLLRTTLMAATAVSVAALAVTATAYADGDSGMGGDMGGHAMHGQVMGGHGSSGQGMRPTMPMRGLDSIKADLKLTAAQQPAFDRYADLVNTQAEARQRMHDGMRGGTSDHRAMHDTMQAYNRQAATELAAAREALYGVLIPDQRAIAERYLGDSRMAMGGGREHRH